MKVAVFGASGGTGKQVVKQALGRGHSVVAIVRDTTSFDVAHPHLLKVRGDAMRPETFADALQDTEAVVSTLGISSFAKSLRPMTFHRRSISNIIGRMKQANVQRLLCVTSTGVIHNPTAPHFYNLLVQPLLRHKYEDMRDMEAQVKSSGLQWTIARPFRLTDGMRTGTYRTSVGGTIDRAGKIARADLADFLLQSLECMSHLHEAVAIAY